MPFAVPSRARCAGHLFCTSSKTHAKKEAITPHSPATVYVLYVSKRMNAFFPHFLLSLFSRAFSFSSPFSFVVVGYLRFFFLCMLTCVSLCVCVCVFKLHSLVTGSFAFFKCFFLCLVRRLVFPPGQVLALGWSRCTVKRAFSHTLSARLARSFCYTSVWSIGSQLSIDTNASLPAARSC